MKTLSFLILCILLSVPYFTNAQWAGSTTSNDLIYRDGNVLIGSTTFSGSYGVTERILQLQGTATYLSMVSTTNGGSFNLSYSGTYGTGLYSRGAQISFWTSPTVSGAIAERMRIGGDGNVGIGTTSPRGKFDVDGPGDIFLADDVIAGTTQSVFLPGHIYLSPYNGGNVSYLQARRSDNSGTTSLRLRTYNNGTLTDAMQIDGNGNVGIGTTTPSSKLNVSEGDIRINATTTNRYLILDALSSVNIATMISLKRSDVGRWLFGASGNSGTDNFEFFRYSDTGAFLGSALELERSTGNAIFQNNVAIGTPLTTNPNNYKLAVNGKIGAKEVQVENTSSTWADYVFEPDYNLRSLEEIENFIKVNKHLPEIPSQKDIETNGHKLGEMDVLLLKKVEELTLYMIELSKANEELKKEMAELKKGTKDKFQPK